MSRKGGLKLRKGEDVVCFRNNKDLDTNHRREIDLIQFLMSPHLKTRHIVGESRSAVR